LLFLRGFALAPDAGLTTFSSFGCEGPDPCSGGTMQGGGDIKDAAPGHAKGILEAWQARPKGGEEQTLTVLGKK
jgi:hypothetical protein